MDAIIEQLVHSAEPAIRYKTRVDLLGEDPTLPDIQRLRQEIKQCARVRQLLSERQPDGTLPHHPYAKWTGAHWVLVMLAELKYPAGEKELLPLREQVYGWLFSKARLQAIERYMIAGRTRMCASMEGNAIFALLQLGLADERIRLLVERLMAWQWADGGWNCDKKPEAHVSSFMETLIPLRALAHYSQMTGNAQAHTACLHAAELFLQRRLFKRLSDGTVIAEDFLRLRYPCYWHYDILWGLKVIAEVGVLADTRCDEALEVLTSKRLVDGGFPAEKKHYQVTNPLLNGYSLVDWGGTSLKRMNPFVTVEALSLLKRSSAGGSFSSSAQAKS
jgi:hypothetical protein